MTNIDPRLHRGGQELPDEVQDRPEQNEGYDEAVRGGRDVPADPALGRDALQAEDAPRDLELPVEDEDEPASRDVDEDMSRAAAADVRRRDRSAG